MGPRNPPYTHSQPQMPIRHLQMLQLPVLPLDTLHPFESFSLIPLFKHARNPHITPPPPPASSPILPAFTRQAKKSTSVTSRDSVRFFLFPSGLQRIMRSGKDSVFPNRRGEKGGTISGGVSVWLSRMRRRVKQE